MLDDAEGTRSRQTLLRDPLLIKLATSLGTALSLAILLFSLTLTLLFLHKFMNAFTGQEDILATSGIIVNSGIKTYTNKNTSYEYFSVIYDYNVNGTIYSRHRYSKRYNGVPTGFGFDGDMLKGKEQETLLSGEYPPGKHVLVYYAKHDPSGGELRVSRPSDFSLMLGMLAGLNVLTLFQFVVVLRCALGRKHTPPSCIAPSSMRRK